MPEKDNLNLPFLTRRMLAYEQSATFDLEIVWIADNVHLVHVAGSTKEGPFRFATRHTGDLSQDSSTFQIPDVPIFISVVTDTANVGLGSIYAVVYLRINQIRVMKLCSGYITSMMGLSWPTSEMNPSRQNAGLLTSIAGSNPATSAQIFDTFSTPGSFRIRSVRVALVTTTTAANRRVHLVFRDGDNNPIYEAISSVDQAESTTRNYTFAPYPALLTAADDNDILVPIPDNLLLQDGDDCISTVTNFQTGDDWGAPIYFIERYLEV